MRRRPVCILCLLLVVFLCVTDWLGFSLIRGNPLPESVQTWIKKHPESTICGEVVRCQENEDVISVYLKNTYLIYYSEEKSDLSLKGQSEKEFEKISIYNVKVYLKKKKNFRQEVWFWCPGNWKKSKVRQIPENLTAGSIMRVGILIM